MAKKLLFLLIFSDVARRPPKRRKIKTKNLKPVVLKRMSVTTMPKTTRIMMRKKKTPKKTPKMMAMTRRFRKKTIRR